MANRRRTPEDLERDLDKLARELGFEDLSYEACFRELFGEAFNLPPAGSKPPGASRVSQAGPGRQGPSGGVEAEVDEERDEDQDEGEEK